MFVRIGRADELDVPFAVHGAVDIVAGGALDAARCVQFQANIAEAGFRPPDDGTLEFVDALGLSSGGEQVADEVSAFLELYGHWLGHGWLDCTRRAVVIAANNRDHAARLGALLQRLCRLLPCCDVGVERADLISTLSICAPAWYDYFSREYCREPTSPKQCQPDSLHMHESKWLWPWFRHLDQQQTRSILRGLRGADCQEAASDGSFLCSSLRLRDELTILAIHAGFSVHFVPCRGGWTLNYDADRHAMPTLNIRKSCRTLKHTGRVWYSCSFIR
jgi:hypothetical protein